MKNRTLIIVKMTEDVASLSHLQKAYENIGHYFYNVKSADKERVLALEDKLMDIVFLVYKKISDEIEVSELYWGETKNIIQRDNNVSINCDVLFRANSKLITENFISCFELQFDKDFELGSYLSIEISSPLFSQFKFIFSPYYGKLNTDVQKFASLRDEANLHNLAQKNENCEREIGLMISQENRGEFQRDYERIIHSKAFRRLVDKAQIFTASKGDHYRTRMTHTLAVSQIARGVAKSLNLNSYLTESIALGHDLGHTPFGHQGERTLDDLLKGEVDQFDFKFMPRGNNIFGGFKHNFHSLRVISHLEEEYIEFNGLNLSVQTAEGIWKHTKTLVKDCSICKKSKCDKKCYNLEDFYPKDKIEKLSPNQYFSFTLEGQVVAIADEIAQRGHDLDDALSSRLISVGDLKEYLELNKMSSLKTKINDLCILLEQEKDKNRIYANDKELLHSRITSQVIHYFINDVVEESQKNIGSYDSESLDNKIINKKLVMLSEKGDSLCNYLEKIISKKVINSSEVALFDSRANLVIKSLFYAYYNNPRLLHEGTLNRIYVDYRRITENVINFREGDLNIVTNEWKKILEHDLSNLNIDEFNTWNEEDKEYWIKRKILVRNIVDFIAGMTDSYALNEYERICK